MSPPSDRGAPPLPPRRVAGPCCRDLRLRLLRRNRPTGATPSPSSCSIATASSPANQLAQENLPGGFSAVYDVLKALEESGRIRRGYFVDGLGATQFALPAAVDLLRSLRNNAQPERAEIVTISATDPANAYGAVLRWPTTSKTQTIPTRPTVRSPAALARASFYATANSSPTSAATTPTCSSFFPATNPTAATPPAISRNSLRQMASARCVCVLPIIAAECWSAQSMASPLTCICFRGICRMPAFGLRHSVSTCAAFRSSVGASETAAEVQ